jgi:hypothetical protein
MYFGTKNYLKSNRYRTAKHILEFIEIHQIDRLGLYLLNSKSIGTRKRSNPSSIRQTS